MTEKEKFLFDLQGFVVVESTLNCNQLTALNRILDERIAAESVPISRLTVPVPTPCSLRYRRYALQVSSVIINNDLSPQYGSSALTA